MDLLEPPIDWMYEGKLYKVCKVDLFIEGQFCGWVMREAAIALETLQETVSATFYDLQMRVFNSKVCGKQFKWDSEDVSQAAWTAEGRKHLLWLKVERGTAVGGARLPREAFDKLFKDETKDPVTGLTKWTELTDILYMQDYPGFFAREIKPLREKEAAARKAAQEQEKQSQSTTASSSSPDHPSTSP